MLYFKVMKRKFLAVLTCFLMIFPLAASPSLRFKMLESPMKNIAYAREYSDGMINSAAFCFRTDEVNFFVSQGVTEKYKETPFKNQEPFSILQNFSLNTLMSFGSDYLMLTGSLDSGVADKNIEGDSITYDFNTFNRLQVDAFYRYKFFSIGFRMEGGNQNQRAGREVSSYNDVLANMFFEKFASVEGSEYFNTGISSYFRFNDFSATFVVDELIKVLDTGSIGTSWKQIMHSLSLGASYESPRYKADGNLHLVRFRAGLSLEHFLSSTDAVNSLTCDIDFQLLPDISIIFGAGVRNMQRLDALFKTPSADDTYQSFELKAKMLRASVSFNLYYPVAIYNGWNDNLFKFAMSTSIYF